MRAEVMTHYGLVQPLSQAGYYEGRIPIFPVKQLKARGENLPYVLTGSTVQLCSRHVA
jgi:hypothetical protein